jgi:hypothetical protein
VADRDSDPDHHSADAVHALGIPKNPAPDVIGGIPVFGKDATVSVMTIRRKGITL